MVGDLVLANESDADLGDAAIDDDADDAVAIDESGEAELKMESKLKKVVVVTSDFLEALVAQQLESASGIDRDEALRLLFLRRAVLPLPGYEAICAPNMEDFYQKLLAEDGLSLRKECWENKSFPGMSLRGDYRRMLAVRCRLSWVAHSKASGTCVLQSFCASLLGTRGRRALNYQVF